MGTKLRWIEEEASFSIHQTNDEEAIMIGYTSSEDIDVTENKGIMDFWIVKLSSLSNTNEEMENFPVISLSPNPVSDRLHIHSEQPGELLIQVSDIRGKTLISTTSNLKHSTIDLRHLPSATYLVSISTKGQTVSHKIIKQ